MSTQTHSHPPSSGWALVSWGLGIAVHGLVEASLASNDIDMLRGLCQEDACRRTHEGEGA